MDWAERNMKRIVYWLLVAMAVMDIIRSFTMNDSVYMQLCAVVTIIAMKLKEDWRI